MPRAHPWRLANREDVDLRKDLLLHFAEELQQPRPVEKVLAAVLVAVGRDRGRIGQAGRLGDHIDDVHAEAIDALVQPPAHHVEDLSAHPGVFPVEVRLLLGEEVQIILAGGFIILPGRAAEVGCPVVGLAAVPGRAPDVVIAIGTVHRLAGLDEPRVLVRGVIDHQVHHQLDAPAVHLCKQLFPVGQRAEVVHDVAVVADIVAVVVVGRLVHGGEPDDINPKGLEIIQLADDPT